MTGDTAVITTWVAFTKVVAEDGVAMVTEAVFELTVVKVVVAVVKVVINGAVAEGSVCRKNVGRDLCLLSMSTSPAWRKAQKIKRGS